MVYSLASAVGQNFIYYTITQFNPLILTTVRVRGRVRVGVGVEVGVGVGVGVRGCGRAWG